MDSVIGSLLLVPVDANPKTPKLQVLSSILAPSNPKPCKASQSQPRPRCGCGLPRSSPDRDRHPYSEEDPSRSDQGVARASHCGVFELLTSQKRAVPVAAKQHESVPVVDLQQNSHSTPLLKTQLRASSPTLHVPTEGSSLS